MMRVTFLEHSGFLVELPSVTLIFDWWKGALPEIRHNVPLLIFASHRHEDHFHPSMFSLEAEQFILGSDISLRRLDRLGVSPEIQKKCRFLRENETCSPLPGITVETLPSTDEGVAFLVTADGKTIFHAGDLNWWHWEGEPDPWNPDMAVRFQQYSEPLRNRSVDLAFLPLDPRQEHDGFRGARYFLELAKISHFIPMHQWDNFTFTEQFLACYPEFTKQTVPVSNPGQVFTF